MLKEYSPGNLVVAIDIDGTALEYPEKVNAIYNTRGHVVILHTARPESIREQTVQELAAKGVQYHALVMDKLRADYYIDDKNATFELEPLPLL